MAWLSTLLTQWPTDWIIVIALAALVALDALRGGSNRACAISIALPLSLLALASFEKAAFLAPFASQISAYASGSVLFFVMLVAFYFFSRRIIGFWSDSREGVIQALLAGLATTIIALVVWLQIPSLDTVWHFGPQIQNVFSEAYRFWWLLISFAALAFVRS
ncbi:MAG: hypothetical protein NUV59_01170 [Patescibacteria group bacterium]|nr:hypothetical protein [Patescibacteria group bacterium]